MKYNLKITLTPDEGRTKGTNIDFDVPTPEELVFMFEKAGEQSIKAIKNLLENLEGKNV